jgi:hypothetical protein
MSHRICYHHFAVSFPSKELEVFYPTGRPSWEQSYYILLELGGDNNVTTTNPSGREVGYRTWSAIGYGEDTKVMEQAVLLSASCEGGNCRLHGEHYTFPESYIRRIRNVMSNPMPFQEVIRNCFSLSVKLKLNRPDPWDDAVNTLNQHLGEQQENGVNFWILHPLDNPLHAAFLMLYGKYVDDRSCWNIFDVDGPCFQQQSRNFFSRPIKKVA